MKIEYSKRTENIYKLMNVVAVEWDESGIPLKVMMISQDIGKRHELENLANTDGLTGLFNERYFSSVLHRKEKKKLPFVLYYLDLDHFKPVNDTYGHAFGDVVLKEVADICARHKGAAGFCARYGGEEFAIIFKGAGVGQAEEMAEQIRQEFEQKMFTTPQGERSFSVSIGVAEYDRAYAGASAFFEVADAALYRAKREGKNQVRR